MRAAKILTTLMACGAFSVVAAAQSIGGPLLSLRIGTTGAPQFVALSQAQTAAQANAIVGCDGATYYISAPDSARVSYALSHGGAVQLHRGTQGISAANAPLRCMIQAGR